MFGTGLLVIGTLIHIYVFWRATSVPVIRRRVPRRVLIGSGLVLWVVFILGRILGHGHVGFLAQTLELFGMTWLATLFLTFISLLVVDLVTGFGFFFPRLAPSLRGWSLIAGVTLSVIANIQGLRPPIVQHYEVRLAGLPAERDGTVLVAMSDLHLGSLLGEGWLEARVAQVQSLRPDMVVLLGDLFEGHGQPQGEMLESLRQLSAPLGVWAVSGNHESHGGREQVWTLLEKSNIPVLHNQWVEVCPGIILSGVDDLTAARRTGREDEFITQALADRPPGVTIVLSHTPGQTETAAQAGVGLMLCGHTHGGQIWPLGYLTRIRYPLLAGRYEVGRMSVIVCRGTGTWGPRMRLWRPSEILHVTLLAENR